MSLTVNENIRIINNYTNLEILNNLFISKPIDYIFDLSLYKYSIDGIIFDNSLSDIILLNSGIYDNFYFTYPDLDNNTTTSIKTNLIIKNNSDIQPKMSITVNYKQNITFTDIYDIYNGYDNSSINLINYKYYFIDKPISSVKFISNIKVNNYLINIDYFNTITNSIDTFNNITLIINKSNVNLNLLSDTAYYDDIFNITNFIELKDDLNNIINIKNIIIKHNYTTINNGDIMYYSGITSFIIEIYDDNYIINPSSDFTNVEINKYEFVILFNKKTIDFYVSGNGIVKKNDIINNNYSGIIYYLNNSKEGDDKDNYNFMPNYYIVDINNINVAKCDFNFTSIRSTNELLSTIDLLYNDTIITTVNFITTSTISLKSILLNLLLNQNYNKIRLNLRFDEQIIITKIASSITKDTYNKSNNQIIDIIDLNYDTVLFKCMIVPDIDINFIDLGLVKLNINISDNPNINITNMTFNLTIVETEVFDLILSNNIINFGDDFNIYPQVNNIIITEIIKYDFIPNFPIKPIHYDLIKLPEIETYKLITFGYEPVNISEFMILSKFLGSIIIPNKKFTLNPSQFVNNEIDYNILIDNIKYNKFTLAIGFNIENVRERLITNNMYGNILNNYLLTDNELYLFIKDGSEYQIVNGLFTYSNELTDYSISLTTYNIILNTKIVKLLNNDSLNDSLNDYIFNNNQIILNRQLDTYENTLISDINFSILLNDFNNIIQNYETLNLFVSMEIELIRNIEGKERILIERFDKIYSNNINVLYEHCKTRSVIYKSSNPTDYNTYYYHYMDIKYKIYPQMSLNKNDILLKINKIGFNIL